MDKNLLDFCNNIESLYTVNSIESFVPSKKAQITLTPLTLKQQKDVIASQVSGVVGLVGFGRVLNNILVTNSKASDLLVCDKSALAISLRIGSISNKIGDIDLNEMVERFKANLAEFKFTETVEDCGITANLAIPTIVEETKIIESLESVIYENEDDIATNMSNIYTFEVVKYIKSLSIKDVTLDFDKIPNIKDRVDILERLPLSLNRKIVDYIEYNKLQEKKVLTWKEEVIDISADFFDFE